MFIYLLVLFQNIYYIYLNHERMDAENNFLKNDYLQQEEHR